MNTCTGKGPDGTQCTCRRFNLRPDQVAGDPPTCWSCCHWETCHPEPTLASMATASKPTPVLPSNIPEIFSSSRALFKGGMIAGSSKTAAMPLKPSGVMLSSSNPPRLTAHIEANSGFRSSSGSHVQAPATARGRSQAKSRQIAKKSGPEDDMKAHGVGRIIILPCGFDKQNRTRLNETSSPNNAKQQDLLRCNLAVDTTNDRPIRFDPNWNTGDVDQYLRSLFPLLFNFLDERHPPKADSLHWTLLAKGGRQLSVASMAGRTQPVATDILCHRYPASKSWESRCVWIALNHEVLIEVYETWDPAWTAGVGDHSFDSEQQTTQPVYSSLTDADHLLFGPLTDSEAETDIEDLVSNLKGKGKEKANAYGTQKRYNLREKKKRLRVARSSSPIELIDTDVEGQEPEAENNRKEDCPRRKRRRVTLGAATESLSKMDLKSKNTSSPTGPEMAHGSDSSDVLQVAGPSSMQLGQVSGRASSNSGIQAAGKQKWQNHPESDTEGSPAPLQEADNGSPHDWWSALSTDLLPPPAKNPWTR